MTLPRQATPLRPTPTDPDGGALLSPDSSWWRSASDTWESGTPLPVVGNRHRRDGVDMVEVTFLARLPGATAVQLHLNGITDAHRHDLRPSLMRRVPGAADLWGTSRLLCSDAIHSYRIADVSGMAHDIGDTRPGWLRVHEAGRSDSRNPDTMPTPLGGACSVFTGPDAPWHDWPAHETLAWQGHETSGVQTRVLPGDDRVVVCFDQRHWAGNRLGEGIRRAGLGHTVVMIDNGVGSTRADLLTAAEPAARLVAVALQAASEVLGRRHRQAEAVAGQSFGGLATAWVLATRPDLVRAGIVQSGSFWHTPGATPRFDVPGELVQRLRTGWGDASVPVIVQVGTEEGDMVDHSQWYVDALTARDAAVLDHRTVRGGHDHAWWRHGLVDALLQLESAGGSPAAVDQ